MKRLVLWILLLGLASAAGAEDTPPSPFQMFLDDVMAKAKAGDVDGVAQLAARTKPDPWMVAEALLEQDAAEAARTFAKATPKVVRDKLAPYVETWAGKKLDAAAATMLDLVWTAFRKRDWKAIREHSEGARAGGRVSTLRIRGFRVRALLHLRQHVPAAALASEVVATANQVGWASFERQCLDWHAQAHFRQRKWDEALSSWQGALAIANRLDDVISAASALMNIAIVHQRRLASREALDAMQRAHALLTKSGDELRAAKILANIGLHEARHGQLKDAVATLTRAHADLEKVGDRKTAALVLSNLGSIQSDTGALRAALATQQKALALVEELGSKKSAARVLGNIGNVHLRMGDLPKSLNAQKRALAMKEALDDQEGVAVTMGNLANVYDRMGNLSKALTMQRRVLDLKKKLGAQRGMAITYRNLANLYQRMGEYPRALEMLARSQAIHEKSGDRVRLARTLVSKAAVYMALGDQRRCIALAEQALKLQEAAGDRMGSAHALAILGAAHQMMRDLPEALERLEEARALHVKLGSRPGELATLSNIANVHEMNGEFAKALATHQIVLDASRKAKTRARTVRTIGRMGSLHRKLGDLDKALDHFERGVRAARRLRVTPILAEQLGWLARVRLEMGDAGRALETAQQAVPYLEELLGGLGEETGASARARYAPLFGAGALAAARLEEPAEVLGFLENGRAGALLEALDGRQAMAWSAVPDDLRAAEAEAKAAYAVARHDYARARDTGQRKIMRAASKVLDGAQGRLRDIAALIQRRVKKDAQIFYPRVATLDEVQAALPKHTALVLYGLCLEQGLALVVTQDDARIALLGKVNDIAGACTALQADDTGVDPAAAITSLRKLLVDPLQLDESIRSVLVSPEGCLCYVPLAAMFGDRDAAFTPSATTHVLLAGEAPLRGEGILALGDPEYGEKVDPGAAAVYRAGRLASLPATRAEAKAVGDVVLLGADATETNLRKTLATRKRWRAVHLACHGLVQPDRPTQSSLALSRGDDEDGFLTCLEVLRTRIPADITVLSACETGKGRIVRGEGVVGLMRAFMYAGAPRVVCSLWKVDDEATGALMKKFYELWNADGTTSAASALRQAQAFVRSHDKWKHPYFWAAWALWGLPE